MPIGPGHPRGYRQRQLRELLTLEYGGSLPDGGRHGGDVPVLGSNGIVGSHSKPMVDRPGIVVGRKGSIGKVTWVDRPFWPIDTTYFVDPKTTHSQRWLYYLLDSLGLDRLNSATGVPGLNRDDAYVLKVPVPDEATSEWIAGAIDAVDAAIDATRGVIEQTRRLKTAVLQDLLTRGLPGRHSEFREVKGFGQVPRAWSVVALGELLEDLRYGTSAKCTSDRQSVAVLRIPNIVRDTTEDVEMKWADLPPAELKRLRLMAGDVVLVRTNGNPNYVGRSVVFSQESGVWAFASYLIRARCKREQLLPEYLHAFLNSHRGRRELVGGIRTSAGNYNLNTDTIRTTRIPLPDPDEQGAIVGALRSIEQRVDEAEAHLFGLSQLKTALSQALLTGRVRVPAQVAEGVF